MKEPEFVENTQDLTNFPPKISSLPDNTGIIKLDSEPSTSHHSNALAHPDAWKIPAIPCSEPEDGTFYVHLGPIGRKESFTSVTGI